MAPARRARKHPRPRQSQNAQPAQSANNPFEQRWAKSVNTALKRSKRHVSSNTFVDARIAERDPSISDEHRYLLRLQRERTNRQKRSLRFNLNRDSDDDHDHDDDPSDQSDAEEADPPTGPLFTKKSPADGDDVDNHDDNDAHDGDDRDDRENDVPKSKQEVMNEIIQKSKTFKFQRQQDKDQVDTQTATLDTKFPEILDLLHSQNAKPSSKPFDSDAPTALSVAAAAAAATGETPDIQSSQANVGKANAFQYDDVYRMLAEEKRARPSNRLLTQEEIAENERNRLVELERKRNSRMNQLDDADDTHTRERPGVDDLDDDGTFADNLSNAGSEAADDDESGKVNSNDEYEDESSEKFWIQFSEDDVLALTEQTGEVPFVFKTCPKSSSELQALFARKTLEQRNVVVERVLKCFSVSLDAGRNRPKLEQFLECLLFRIERLCEVSSKRLARAIDEMDMLLVHVHGLGGSFERVVSAWGRARVEECGEKLIEGDQKNSLSDVWEVSDILVLRCLSRLFPSSDLRHGVSTALGMALSEALSVSRMKKLADVALGVFVGQVLMEAIGGRKGYSPELAQFVSDVLLSCCEVEVGDGEDAVGSLHEVFAELTEENVGSVKSSPLRLRDCARLMEGKDGKIGTKLRVAFGVVGIAEVMFDEWVPHADLVLYEVVVEKLRICSMRERMTAVLERVGKDREPMALYTRRERVVLKTLNPRIRSTDQGVYHKRGRMRYGGGKEEMEAAGRRVKKALRKEVRGFTRDVRKEASNQAVEQLAMEDRRRQKADAKDREVRAFFELQQSTWRAAEKRQHKLAGKKW